jgi:predicted kinase
MLVIFSGLPGVGKTSIARELAGQIGAVHLRIDSIEQALRSRRRAGSPVYEEGFVVAYAVAEDNLRLGQIVIADSVNPIQITRDSWREVAQSANASTLEVEVVCIDATEHRRRVETRNSDIPGLRLPIWEDVIVCEYAPWDRSHLAIDTALQTLEQNVAVIREALSGTRPPSSGIA